MPQNLSAENLLKEIAAQREADGRVASKADQDNRSTALVKTFHAEPEEDGVPVMAPPSWNTVTMANIYASQGHFEHARQIYRTILTSEPDNTAARKGLEALP
jgi:hypothetical protein